MFVTGIQYEEIWLWEAYRGREKVVLFEEVDGHSQYART